MRFSFRYFSSCVRLLHHYLVSQGVIHIVAVFGQFVLDGVLLAKAIDNALCGTSANGIPVQVEDDGVDLRVYLQVSFQRNRHHILSFGNKNTGKRQQMILVPIPALKK